jgi:catechol 2,3-dioxygenase-like lactoylglutathione lyase family enzyme
MVAFLLLTAATATATTAELPGAGTAAAKQLADAEDQLFQAKVRKDFDALAKGLADEALYVHVPGLTQTKSEHIEQIRNGRLDYRSIATEDRLVRVFGNVGITRGKIIQTVGERNNNESYLAVYIRRDGRWQMLDWRTSPIPKSQPGPAAATQPSGEPSSAGSVDNPLELRSDHVTISVADIDKLEAWYVQVLGFREIARGKGVDFEHRQLSIPGVYRIDLSWRKGSARHTVGPPSDLEQGWRHIVFTTPNLENTLQSLGAQKVEVRVDRNTKDNAISQLFITDPEGNEIELQRR